MKKIGLFCAGLAAAIFVFFAPLQYSYSQSNQTNRFYSGRTLKTIDEENSEKEDRVEDLSKEDDEFLYDFLNALGSLSAEDLAELEFLIDDLAEEFADVLIDALYSLDGELLRELETFAQEFSDMFEDWLESEESIESEGYIPRDYQNEI